jgi:hypothetical protein
MTNDVRKRSFDALSRGMANGDLSRRKALSLLGGVLVGGSLATMSEVAEAAAPDRCAENNPCTSNPSGCCATARGVACCGGGEPPVCCIRRGRPTCEISAEFCLELHGRPR